MKNPQVQALIDQGVSQRTAYRRVKCEKRINPEVKAIIDQGFSRSYAYRKFKKNAPNRANRKTGIATADYAFSKGEFV